jgi:hypothetical protein
MKLQDLEATSPSQLLGDDPAPLNGPACPEDKSIYLTHDIVPTQVVFPHGDLEILVELWLVLDAPALVFVGPKDWLLAGTPWFCRDDQDLVDLLYFQMEEVWGPEPYSTGDPGVGLAAMSAAISVVRQKLSTVPPASADSSTTGQDGVVIDDLDLV